MKTKELFSNWLNSLLETPIKARTHDRYCEIVYLHLIPTLGELEVCTIDRYIIQAFLKKEKQTGNHKKAGKGLSASSMNLIYSVLTSAFEYACEYEIMSDNPCRHIKREKSRGKRIEAFTREEQRRIETVMQEEWDNRYFGIMLALYTGLRIGELLALEWCDFDFEQQLIRVSKTIYRKRTAEGTWAVCVDSPKTETSDRVIPIPNCLIQLALATHKARKSPYVVENKKGERMPIRSYQYLFQRIEEKSNVRRLNFHALRHTFSTRALEWGMDIKTLSELLGHSSATITLNRYVHSMMETKVAMMNKLQLLW